MGEWVPGKVGCSAIDRAGAGGRLGTGIDVFSMGKTAGFREARKAAAERGRGRGFTLIELLAVMAILAVLAGLTFGIARIVSVRREEARAQADLQVMQTGLEAYRSRAGDYPWVGDAPVVGEKPAPAGAEALLRALTGFRAVDPARPATLKAGQYLDTARLRYGGAGYDPNVGGDPAGSWPEDPWGNPYVYLYNVTYPKARSGWKNPGYLLLSAGPDGKLALPAAVVASGTIDLAAYAAEPVNEDNVAGRVE